MTTIWSEGNNYGQEYTPKVKATESDQSHRPKAKNLSRYGNSAKQR